MKQWIRVEGADMDRVEETESIWKRRGTEAERTVIEALKEVDLARVLSPVQIQILQAIVYDGLTIGAAGRRVKISTAAAQKEFTEIGRIIRAELAKLDK